MKQIYNKKIFLFLLFLTSTIFSQNTVGILSNKVNSLDGYTLFTTQNETYLINNCGEVVNQWTSNYKGGIGYLLENGNLLRTAKIDNPGNIAIPGVAGRIELFDWDGNMIWEYDFTTTTRIQHHDIFPMPNGNILVLSAAILSDTEAIQMGRDPAKLTETQIYTEQVIELEPVGTNDANEVWKWNIKDHLIQDFDSTKDNYGVVGENQQLLDFNYIGLSTGGNANWLHINSVQYNAQLDQIILSTRHLSEIYIIDHSTTTVESASNTGGIYGKGGDLLYRWGNPLVYRQGTLFDQQLDGQHFPHWIPKNYNDGGKIILFNNGVTRPSPSFSEVFILNPPANSPGFYNYLANSSYGPNEPEYIYTAPVKADFFSPLLSSAQRLPNGNTFICEGTSGHFFEIDSNENIVWEYINPVGITGIMNQGDDPTQTTNNMFRAYKYSANYSAFNGKTLTPGPPIELNPDLSQCAILSVDDVDFKELALYPNPVENSLNIVSDDEIEKVEIYDVQGRKINVEKMKNNINFTTFNKGIYFLKIFTKNRVSTNKVIKI